MVDSISVGNTHRLIPTGGEEFRHVTSILSSLALVVLHPPARTMKGMVELIVREWVGEGYVLVSFCQFDSTVD